MSKVRTVQVLYPQRHCILGAAYQSPDGEPIPKTTEYLKLTVEEAIEEGRLNPWCGICQSRKWVYEDQPTIYATMEEAMPWLKECEAAQGTVREYLKASRS